MAPTPAMPPEFLFDYGSPNAYLVHRAIPQTGVAFDYIPVLLGGIFKAIGNQSPMQSYGHIGAKVAYDRLEMQRFMARYGIDKFTMNPHFPVNTLQIMRGAVAARRLGVAAAYDEAMFAGMWERGLKLDLPDVIERTLAEAGLPAEIAELSADPDDQSGQDQLPWPELGERQPQQPRQDHGDRESAECAFPGFLRTDLAAERMTAEEPAESECRHIVQLRREDHIKKVAVSIDRIRKKAEMPEHPADVDKPDDA